jgi:EGF-like domain
MAKISFLTLFVAALVKSAAANTHCDLECANGGYCTLKEGDDVTLAKHAQSGSLIEVCVCRPGFTGVACENTMEQCDSEEGKCHNGLPCEQDSATGEWGCDCTIADSINSFAGKMCRNPTTEYCTGKFQPNSDLYFCTNGGRCLADFIAAQLAPGDTTVNRVYQ